VETQALPDAIAHRLPRYAVQPVLLLGRLARDLSFRGQGIGEILLRDALQRSLATQQRIGAIAVIVDAIDEHAALFYQAYGFIRLTGAVNRLFIAMETIARAAAAGNPQASP
jgi:predicted GNAT family N-acyltransferase